MEGGRGVGGEKRRAPYWPATGRNRPKKPKCGPAIRRPPGNARIPTAPRMARERRRADEGKAPRRNRRRRIRELKREMYAGRAGRPAPVFAHAMERRACVSGAVGELGYGGLEK